MSSSLTIYRPFFVNTRVISLKWMSGLLFDERLRDTLIGIQRADRRLGAYRILPIMSPMTAGESADAIRDRIHSDYEAIGKHGARKLRHLMFFWKNRHNLGRIPPRLGLELKMDLSPYQTQEALVATMGKHVRDTLKLMDNLERFIDTSQLTSFRAQSAFSRTEIALMLTENNAFIDFLAENAAIKGNENHVFNRLIRQQKGRSNVITFNPAAR